MDCSKLIEGGKGSSYLLMPIKVRRRKPKLCKPNAECGTDKGNSGKATRNNLKGSQKLMGHHTEASRIFKLNATRKVTETKIKKKTFLQKKRQHFDFITVLVLDSSERIIIEITKRKTTQVTKGII